MKRTFTTSALLLASMGVTLAQAPRFPLFEHFTQASCGPCAAQNPGFESTILTPNPEKVRHIAYHTSWPGVDPMNAHNPTEVATRVTYYGVSGVPDVYLGGNYKNAQPGGFTQTDVDDYFSLGSPIKINVSEVDMGATRDVTVDVITVGTVPAGSYVLRVAVVEDPIDFATAPGSNGETHFPNVFRKMLPSMTGSTYTAAALGSSVTFNYTYTEDAAWNTANLKVIAFVQNTTTKEVLNSGTVNDPIINYTLGVTGAASAAGVSGSPSTFALTSMNTGTASEDFVYTLSTDAPGDWSATLQVNSTTMASPATVTTAAGATNTININVTPGATPFVATYTLTASSVATPSSPVLIKKVYVISNVTDLIVNNTGGLGDGTTPGDASNWVSVYSAGLAFAGNTTNAATSDKIFKELGSTSSLGAVNNIYYNVGWTFPSITDDEISGLENFMDNGGNIFIAGQDMGWEINDGASPYGTAANQAFYSGYLHGGFSADGGTSNTLLNPVTSDYVYGTAGSATINNYYGGTYFYPDELTTANGGISIFKYNSTTKNGGLRFENTTYKVVYLGVGPEMLNTTNSNTVLKIAHDWFYGLITGVEFNEVSNGGVAVYPNPSNGMISLTSFESVNEVKVFDMMGALVLNKQINKTADNLDLSALSNGTYQVQIKLENGNLVTKKIVLNK